MKQSPFTEEQKKYMIANSTVYTVNEFSKMMNVTYSCVYTFGKSYKLKFKKGFTSRNENKKEKSSMKSTIDRPPAVYSNHSPYGIATDYLNDDNI